MNRFCVFTVYRQTSVRWGLLDVNGVRWLGALVRVTRGMSPGSVVMCVLLASLSGCWKPRMFPTMRTSELLHPCQWTVRFLPEAGAVLKPLPSVSLARGHVWPWGVCLEGELQSWACVSSHDQAALLPPSARQPLPLFLLASVGPWCTSGNGGVIGVIQASSRSPCFRPEGHFLAHKPAGE